MFEVLDYSTDLYYYIGIEPPSILISRTGDFVVTQNNRFGLTKRWFLFWLDLFNVGVFTKVALLAIFLSALHVLVVNQVYKSFKLPFYAFLFLMLNYFFFRTGLHLVRQEVALMLILYSITLDSKKKQLLIVLVASLIHEFALMVIPLIILFSGRRILLFSTILLAALSSIMILTSTMSTRFNILFLHMLYPLIFLYSPRITWKLN